MPWIRLQLHLPSPRWNFIFFPVNLWSGYCIISQLWFGGTIDNTRFVRLFQYFCRKNRGRRRNQLSLNDGSSPVNCWLTLSALRGFSLFVVLKILPLLDDHLLMNSWSNMLAPLVLSNHIRPCNSRQSKFPIAVEPNVTLGFREGEKRNGFFWCARCSLART